MTFLLIAQIVITSISLYYAASMTKSIHTRRIGLKTEQFTQNISLQLNDINNLMLFLCSYDLCHYFQNYMNLRDDDIHQAERADLLNKLESLNLSPDLIESIYFIGVNTNQKACRKATGAQELEDIDELRMETFKEANLEDFFFRTQNQFIRPKMDDFRSEYDLSNPALTNGEVTELVQFLQDIDGRLIVSSSVGTTTDMVLITLVLSETFFYQSLAKTDEQAHYTILRKEGDVLWSTITEPDLLSSIAEGKTSTTTHDGIWKHNRRVIHPFNLCTLYSENSAPNFFIESSLPPKILLVALGTLMIIFLFSYFYLRLMLQPFRRISQAIDTQPASEKGEIAFRPIDPNLSAHSYQKITLRGKLCLLFFIVIGFLIASNTLFYSNLIERETNKRIEKSVESVGSFAAVGIQNQIKYFENLSIQVSMSQKLHQYLIENRIDQRHATRPMEIFPGLSDIHYFALYDAKGICLYSSIYSNNRSIFDIASVHLKDRSDPYWIVNYSYLTNSTCAAVVHRVETNDPDATVNYLLIVPKESAFRIAKTEYFMASYTIRDTFGQELFNHRFNSQSQILPGHLHYQQPLLNTGWTLMIDYVIPEIMTLKEAYQNRFLYSILLVFVFSIGIVTWISNALTRSIRKALLEMQIAEFADIPRQLDIDQQDEISKIISSYNRMIVRLEEMVRENMRMMEENIQNKMREKELLSMKARAEMNMLQAQINPHFLNNTLCAINMKIMRQGNMDISRALSALSKLLRYSMTIEPDLVTLKEEIQHASHYVTLQQLCLGNTFQVEFDVPDTLLDCLVPRVILQPLIENAIKHGFEGWNSGGLIQISVRQKDKMLEIKIKDNGVGIDTETLERIRKDINQELTIWKSDGGGIGLCNVSYRLKLRYQDESQLLIESELMRGTEIRMAIPIKKSHFIQASLSDSM